MKKSVLIISVILSSEFVGEGIQPTIVDANKRLLAKNGKILPESGDIRIALIGDSKEIRENIYVKEINGYDFSKFNSRKIFFFGKSFGGPKLTKISPNKTYSGMIGGYFLSLICLAIITNYIDYYCYSFDDFKGEKNISYENIPNLCDKFKIKKKLTNMKPKQLRHKKKN